MKGLYRNNLDPLSRRHLLFRPDPGPGLSPSKARRLRQRRLVLT